MKDLFSIKSLTFTKWLHDISCHVLWTFKIKIQAEHTFRNHIKGGFYFILSSPLLITHEKPGGCLIFFLFYHIILTDMFLLKITNSILLLYRVGIRCFHSNSFHSLRKISTLLLLKGAQRSLPLQCCGNQEMANFKRDAKLFLLSRVHLCSYWGIIIIEII